MSRSAPIAGLSLVCALAMSAALSASTLAQATLPLELEWQAPAECPAADAVRAQLERSTRVQPGVSLTPLSARARVERGASGYTTKLQTRHDGRDGERDLSASDCETLVRTVTLVLALAFGAGVEVADDGAQSAAHDPAADGESDRAAATASERASADKTSAGDAADEDRAGAVPAAEPQAGEQAPDVAGTADSAPPRWALLAGAGAQFALLPAVALAATAGVEFSASSLSLELRVTGWPGVADDVAPGVQAHFNGLEGAAQGCAQLPLSSLTFALCAGARAAALHGRSTGAGSDGSTTAPWYALAGAASLTLPRGHAFAVRIEGALAVSLDRPRFVIEDLAPVHRVPSLVPDVSALLVVQP